MTKEALIEIVTAETADIEDANERIKQSIEVALRLLDISLEAHQD